MKAEKLLRREKIEMEVNEEKRKKFMEYAGKRVNNVMHDIQILEPMARSNAYDFTKEDVEEMFNAMQETLNDAKAEFDKKFEEKARAEKKVFTFGTSKTTTKINETVDNSVSSEVAAASKIDVSAETDETFVDESNLEDEVTVF